MYSKSGTVHSTSRLGEHLSTVSITNSGGESSWDQANISDLTWTSKWNCSNSTLQLLPDLQTEIFRLWNKALLMYQAYNCILHMKIRKCVNIFFLEPFWKKKFYENTFTEMHQCSQRLPILVSYSAQMCVAWWEEQLHSDFPKAGKRLLLLCYWEAVIWSAVIKVHQQGRAKGFALVSRTSSILTFLLLFSLGIGQTDLSH